MSEHFISLNCASCGARLDVYDDMERFACGYCGVGMMAQRRGGTVTLTAVTEAIQKVQVGTDKTAAELALARLRQEVGHLTANRTFVENEIANAGPGEGAIGCFALVGLCALALILTGLWFFGFIVLVVIAAVASSNNKTVNARTDRLRARLEAIKPELERLDQEIRRNRLIVEGKQP